jgi:hypothetical protein
MVPQLIATVSPGRTVLRAAVLALPLSGDATSALAHPPPAPDLAELRQLFATAGVVVTATLVP